MTPKETAARKNMLQKLARQNAVLGAIQIGQLSSKQLQIDTAQRIALEEKMAKRFGSGTKGEKDTPAPMATWAEVI